MNVDTSRGQSYWFSTSLRSRMWIGPHVGVDFEGSVTRVKNAWIGRAPRSTGSRGMRKVEVNGHTGGAVVGREGRVVVHEAEGGNRVAYVVDYGLTVYERSSPPSPFLKMDVTSPIHQRGWSCSRGPGGQREGEGEEEGNSSFRSSLQ